MAQIVFNFSAEEKQHFSEALIEGGSRLQKMVISDKDLSERVLEQYIQMSQEIMKDEPLTLNTSEISDKESLKKAYYKLAEVLGFFSAYRAKYPHDEYKTL